MTLERMETINVIDRLDPRRDTGERNWSIFVYGLLMMICNLINTFYTYMLTSHPVTILLVYLMCYVQFGSFAISIVNTMNLMDAGSKIPYI